MSSERTNLYNELSEKEAITEQFNRTDKRFKFDLEYIKETSVEDPSNNLVIESSYNNIQLVVGPDKNIELFGKTIVKESINLTTLVLSSDASFNSKVNMSDKLVVEGDVSLNSSVDISNNLNVNTIFVKSDISINGDINVGNNLRVDKILVNNDVSINGDVSLNSSVDISDRLVVYGDISLNSSVDICNRLVVNGDISLNNNVDISSNLYVNGDVSFQSNLDVSEKIITTDLTTLNDTSLNGAVTIEGRLDVSNVINTELGIIHADIVSLVGGDVFIEKSNGSSSVLSKLVVIGDSSFSDNLNIGKGLEVGNDGGETIINNDVSLNKNVDISENLKVDGNTELLKKLIVYGDASFVSNVDIIGKFNINDLEVAGDVSYNKNVDISNRLVVNGDISLNSSVDISNKLYVNGDVSFQRNLDVSGIITTTNLNVLEDVSLGGFVDIENNLNVKGDISVNNDIKLGNKLIVGSDVSLNSSVDISNDLIVNNKLIVGNDVSLNKNVDITENLAIGGNIVANNATFADFSATNIIVNENVIEIGKDINNSNPVKIGIGSFAGHSLQGDDSISIGRQAGLSDQGANSISIGLKSGNLSQRSKTIALGVESGFQDQGENAISIGERSGYDTQGTNGIALGTNSGYAEQGTNAIAIGNMAGYSFQLEGNIALGYQAGYSNQGEKGIALGYQAGQITQGSSGIAIGNQAGSSGQGSNSIAIGNSAGSTDQSANSIILNATGLVLNNDSSGLFIDPIRNSVNSKNVMQYDTVTKELIYGEQIDICGTITSGDISCGSLTVGGLIDTQNNDLLMGTGSIVCKRVVVDEMTINGDISLINLDVLERFNVLGDVDISSNLYVNGDVSLNSSIDISDRLVVHGDVSLNSSVDIVENLFVNGDVNISNRLVVGTDASFIGNIDVIGQLGVSDIKLLGDVSFQENVDVNKRLNVTLDSSLNGNVTVATNLRVGARADIISDVSINNSVTIGGGLDITGLTNLGSLNARGDLSINENLLVGKELKVDSDVSLNSSVDITNRLIVNGDVSLNGEVYIQDGNINVGKDKILDVSLGTLILRDDQISGDKINGGTIDEITISKLTGLMDVDNQEMLNVNISGGRLEYISISNSNIELSYNNILDVSKGTLLLRDNQISGDKINGGTIDDISISKLGGSMDCNDQSMSNVNIINGKISFTTISNEKLLIDSNNIICLSNGTIDVSSGTLLLRDDQISGDKINGGTIDDISISKLGGSMDCSDQLMSNVNISGGILNNITISNSDIIMEGKTLDLSGATLLLKDDEISGDKINGGTIDDISISKLGGSMDCSDQLMSNVNISGGLIKDLSGSLGNITFNPGSIVDLSSANVVFAANQFTGDMIQGGTIPEVTIDKLLGAMDCNTQAMTNVNIVSGVLTGVTVNGTITVSTLGGAMNANNQFISNVNIDSGDISNVNINALSYSGPGVVDDMGSESETSSKLATVGAIKSYILYGSGGGTDGDISFGNMDLSGTLNAKAINLGGDIIPIQDAVFDIGSATKQIKDIYLSSSTLFMGTEIAGEVKPVLTVSGGRAEFIGAVQAPVDVSTNTKLDELKVRGDVTFTNSESKIIIEGDTSLNKNVDVSGVVKAVTFIGDGSQLTGVADVVLDNYSDASLGYLDVCKNMLVLGDLSATTASFTRMTLKGENGEVHINGPPDIYIDPILEGYPLNSGRVIIRGSLQTLGSVTTVGVENIDVSSSNIIINANNPVVPAGGVIVKDQYDISRGILWKNSPHNRWDISDNLHLGSNLDVSGTISGTLVTSAQPNITSVGTLAGLAMNGNIDMAGHDIINLGTIETTIATPAQPNITSVGTLQGASFSANVNMGGNQLLNVSSVEGTILTASQPNITSLGLLTGLSMEGDLDLSGGNITNVGNLAGTLTTGAQPNITSLGELSELKLSGGINLGDKDISDVRYIYTTNTHATNVIATNTVLGDFLSGVLTTAEQPNIVEVGRLRHLEANNITVSHITFSGENVFIDGGDVSINQTLDCSALIVKELTVSGDVVKISANDISLVGIVDICGDVRTTGKFIGDGSKLTGLGKDLLQQYNDASFGHLDVCKNILVREDLSVSGETILSTLRINDLTKSRIVFVGTSGELIDSSFLTFDGSNLIIDTSSSIQIPVGTTAERPNSVKQGQIRYNITDSTFEGYDGNNWGSLGGVKDVDGDTYILAESSPGADNDELQFYSRK